MRSPVRPVIRISPVWAAHWTSTTTSAIAEAAHTAPSES